MPPETAPAPVTVTAPSPAKPASPKAAAIAALGKAEAAQEAEVAATPGAAGESVLEAAAAPEGAPAADPHAKAREAAAQKAAEFRRQSALVAQKHAQRQEQQRLDEGYKAREAQLKAQADALAGDPLAFLEGRKVNPQDIVKRAAEMQDPNYVLKQELEAIKAERAAEKAEQARRAQEQQTEAQRQQYFRDRQTIEAAVEKDYALYPTLDSLRPDYVSFKALNIASQYHQESGEVPDLARVLAYLENEEYKTEQERQTRRKARAPAASEKVPARTSRQATAATPPSRSSANQSRAEKRKAVVAMLERSGRDE